MENSLIDLPFEFTSSSSEQTIALGERLAPLLEKGSVVALRGPLGAGKTCFVKGIARGLGIEEGITSPTYTIVSEYEAMPAGAGPGPVPFYHIDAYRLGGNDDFAAIGGGEIVFGIGISVVEWSENIPSFITEKALRVDIEIRGDNERHIRMYRELKEGK